MSRCWQSILWSSHHHHLMFVHSSQGQGLDFLTEYSYLFDEACFSRLKCRVMRVYYLARLQFQAVTAVHVRSLGWLPGPSLFAIHHELDYVLNAGSLHQAPPDGRSPVGHQRHLCWPRYNGHVRERDVADSDSKLSVLRSLG